MKNRKGFTLIELLAVIAILAILVLIALPNILNLYRNARENVFVSDVQNILRVSQQAYVTNSLTNKNKTCFDSKSNPLDIESKSSLKYKVELSSSGKIISIQVLDNNYQLIKTNGTDIKRDDIGNSKSNKPIKSEIKNENQGLTDCEGNPIIEGTITEPEPEQGIQYDSMLIVGPFDSLDYEKIESIKFATTNKVPEGVLGNEDVSDDESGNIMMWWTDTNNNQLYEITIGGQGGVRANTYTSYLFGLTNLTSIDLTNFDTSQVTDMSYMFGSSTSLESITFGDNFDTSKVIDMSYMFYYCTSLTDLDLSSFNTSQVTDMVNMFEGCTNLETITFGDNFDTSKVIDMSNMFVVCESLTDLDLSHFDTSSVIDMHNMFSGCTKLKSLNLSSFTIREDTDLSCMFKDTDALDIESTGLPNYFDLDERLVCPY